MGEESCRRSVGRSRHVRLLRNLVRATSLIAVLIFLPAAAQNNESPATDFISVWFADHSMLYGVDTRTNQIARRISLPYETSALAVDPNDGAIWVLAHKHLLKFDARSGLALDQELKALAKDLEDTDALALNSYDSSLWLRAKKALLHLNANGELLLAWQAPDKITAFQIDNDGNLSLLTKKQLLRLSPAGDIMGSQDLAGLLEDAKHLAVDSLGDVAWLAGESRLVRIDLTDITQTPQLISLGPKANIKHLALDSLHGDLWLVNEHRVMRYDRSGNQVADVDLRMADLKEVEVLTADPIGRTLWLGAKKQLAHFASDGSLLATIQVENEIEALALANAGPVPSLSLLQPTPGTTTNNPAPPIRLELGATCAGIPCDVGEHYLNRLSLDVTLNGVEIGGLFARNDKYADYLPPARLPEGRNTLSASALDVFGHRASRLDSQFTVDTVAPEFLTLRPADQSILTLPQATISGSLDDPTAIVAIDNLVQLGGEVIAEDPLNFSFRVPLKHGLNSFTVVAIDPATNQHSTTLHLTYQQPIMLTVTSPSNGATAGNPKINVTGTLSAPPGTTVTVNSVAANLDERGGFSAADVMLNSGTNTVTVTATAPDGRTATQAISVILAAGEAMGPISQVSPFFGDNIKVAVSPAGHAVAVWRQQQGTLYSYEYFFYASRYHPGQGWGPAVRISSGALSSAVSYAPVVAMDAVGNAIAVWAQYDWYDGTYSIFANRSTVGQNWSIVDTGRIEYGRGFAYLPDIAMSPDGSAVAVWLQKDYRSPYSVPYSVNANRFQPGTGWGVAVPIESATEWAFFYPHVAVDGQGNANAVWTQYVSGGGMAVFSNRYNIGQGWGQAQAITPRSNSFLGPIVAADHQGNAIAVWQQSDGISESVYAKRFEPDAGWKDAVLLETGAGAADPSFLAMDEETGDTAVGWWQQEGAAEDFFVNYFRPGVGWTGPEKFSFPGGLILRNGRQVAFRYQRNTSDRDSVYVSRRSAAGEWGAAQRVDNSDSGVGSAAMGMDALGNVHVVWSQDNRIYARILSAQAVGGRFPSVTPPSNLTVEAAATLTPVELGTASAVDEHDGSLVATPDKTGPFALGTHVITWRATNSAGNIGTAIQIVTVRDTTPPTVAAPTPISVAISDPGNIPASVDLGSPSISDLFTPISVTNDAPEKFPLGTTVVTWTATDPNGNKSTARQTVTVNFTGSVYVSVTDPAPGANLAADSILVTGTFRGPVNTGITVNGVVALIYGDKFYANNVPLKTGENTMTVTATTPDGSTQTIAQAVISTGISPISINATPASGIAPLKTTFVIGGNSGNVARKIEIDFNGDGAVDFTTADPAAPIEHTYTNPGVYPVKIAVTDNLNVTSNQTLAVVVYDADQVDQLFLGLWSGMNDALKAGDINAAAKYLNESAKRKYQPVLEALLPHMSEIVSSYSPLRRVSVAADIGEYAVNRTINGQDQVFLIYFLRDADGVWRVDAM